MHFLAVVVFSWFVLRFLWKIGELRHILIAAGIVMGTIVLIGLIMMDLGDRQMAVKQAGLRLEALQTCRNTPAHSEVNSFINDYLHEQACKTAGQNGK